jgi:ATP/maltotriose-dependent transcriptional regulator MalT
LQDVSVETTARLVRLQFRFMAEGEGQNDSLIEEAERGIELLARTGDHEGLARAWRLVYYVHGTACRWAAAEEAAERTMEHARLAGNEVMARRLLPSVVTCLLYGPTAVAELIRRCEEVLVEAGDDRKTRALTLRTIAIAESMRGDFARARELYSSSRAILEEVGLNLQAALVSLVSGPIEMAAGELAAAEEELRRDYDALDAMGERNYISTTAALLAEVLYREGRYEESLHLTEISEKIAADDDLTSQSIWRSVRGKLVAWAGRFDEAIELASESVNMVRRSDDTNSQAEALIALAEVLELSGVVDDAIRAVGEASSLFQAKGNVVGAAEALAIEERLRSKAGPDPSLVIDLTEAANGQVVDRTTHHMS